MTKGEREGWEIPLHPLSLDEFGASSSSSLLESLADEPVTTDPNSAKGNLSSLSINPERVAKVIAIGEFSLAKEPSQISGGSRQDLLSGLASWWREAGCGCWRQVGKGFENFHHQQFYPQKPADQIITRWDCGTVLTLRVKPTVFTFSTTTPGDQSGLPKNVTDYC